MQWPYIEPPKDRIYFVKYDDSFNCSWTVYFTFQDRIDFDLFLVENQHFFGRINRILIMSQIGNESSELEVMGLVSGIMIQPCGCGYRLKIFVSWLSHATMRSYHSKIFCHRWHHNRILISNKVNNKVI